MKSKTETRNTCRSVALYSVLSLIGILTVCFISQRSCREAIGFKKCTFFMRKKINYQTH